MPGPAIVLPSFLLSVGIDAGTNAACNQAFTCIGATGLSPGERRRRRPAGSTARANEMTKMRSAWLITNFRNPSNRYSILRHPPN